MAKPNGARDPLKNPARAFSFIAARVRTPMMRLSCWSNSSYTPSINSPFGSSPTSCCTATTRTFRRRSSRLYRRASSTSRMNRDV
ncbi:MAG TPA: hypothetical protein VHE30_11165 [Polyangiaceae bacterium]|nr:hypothetical protein [Polyangiaceae bacterium]